MFSSRRLRRLIAVAVAAGWLSPLQPRAQECDLLSQAETAFRAKGRARVKISGAHYSLDLPSQPSVCGAYLEQDRDEWKKAHAGDGFLFETCAPGILAAGSQREGIIQVFSNEATRDVRVLRDHAARSASVLFGVNLGPPNAKSYALTPTSSVGSLEIGDGLRSAKLKATDSRATGERVEIDVVFECPGLDVSQMPRTSSPPLPAPIVAAQVSASPIQSPRCSVGYHVVLPPNTTALKSQEAALSATSFAGCVKAVETEMAKECREHPNTKDLAVSGSIRFGSVVQVFHTDCDRRVAGEGFCYDFPCVAELKGASGCEACPSGQRHNWHCQCAYGPGEEHQCRVDFQLTNDRWTYQSETSNLNACRSEGEQAMRRYCSTLTLANSGWAEAVVTLWDHGAYQVEPNITRCNELVKGAHFCRGSGCSRPCPEHQCLWNGRCITPRKLENAFCGGQLFCRMCK